MIRIYLAISALILGFLAYHQYTVKQLKTARAKLATTEQSLADERAAFEAYRSQRLADDKLRQKVTDDYQKRIADLERDFADRPYRLYCRASTQVPAATGEGRSSIGTDGASPGSELGTADENLWPAVAAYARDCAVTGERLRALQAFERDRTH